MVKMKRLKISSITLNTINDTISIVKSEGTLILHLSHYINSDTIVKANYPHYNYCHSLKDRKSKNLNYNAYYSQKKKFKKINATAINVAKDLYDLLQYFSKLPHNPPIRDNSIFLKKNHHTALLDYLKIIYRNNKEFHYFKNTQHIEEGNNTSYNILDLESSTLSKTSPIRVQEVTSFSMPIEDFKKVATKLAKCIFHSISGKVKEQFNKEMLCHKKLHFHVETFKAYVLFQAFCASNLIREQGKTTKS